MRGSMTAEMEPQEFRCGQQGERIGTSPEEIGGIPARARRKHCLSAAFARPSGRWCMPVPRPVIPGADPRMPGCGIAGGTADQFPEGEFTGGENGVRGDGPVPGGLGVTDRRSGAIRRSRHLQVCSIVYRLLMLGVALHMSRVPSQTRASVRRAPPCAAVAGVGGGRGWGQGGSAGRAPFGRGGAGPARCVRMGGPVCSGGGARSASRPVNSGRAIDSCRRRAVIYHR